MRRARRAGWVVAGLVWATAAPAAARSYSLPELVATVASDYPGIVSKRESVEAARAQLSQAQRMWLPTGDLYFTLNGTPAVHCMPGDSTTGRFVPERDSSSLTQTQREQNCVRTNLVDLRTGTNATLLNVAPIHGIQLNLSINLNQPLFSFGRIEAQIGNAKANLDVALAALQREQADATFNAVRAYWGVKVARSAVDSLNEARNKLKDVLKRMNEEMDGDNPSHFVEGDLARLKIGMANLEVLLLDQRRNQQFAEEALRILTRDSEATVDSSPAELDELPESKLSDWQAEAQQLRPEIRMNRGWARAAKEWRFQRLAEMLPELSLNSTFGYGYASNMDTPQNWYMSQPSYLNATFALFLHQPLDFGVRFGRYQQADHEARTKTAQIQQAIDGSATEVAQLFANFEEARGRAEELARGERVARGWYNALDQSSNTGLSPSDGREAVEAARNYFEFHIRHLQAVYDTQIALANLRRVVGEKDVPVK